MTKLFLLLISVFLLGSSCNKGDASPKANAKVLSFSADKCMCCWGWTIQIGDSTIHSDDSKIADVIGYIITNPVDVYVELGSKDNLCDKSYSIIQIQKR